MTMQGEHTRALKAYLNPHKSRADRDLMARLLADNAHGKATSAVIRTALSEHYGLTERPTLPQASALKELTAEVEALRQTVADMAAVMQQQCAGQSAEIARLQVALMALAFGDKGLQQRGRAVAASLATLNSGSQWAGR
jgi:hypothetical protein